MEKVDKLKKLLSAKQKNTLIFELNRGAGFGSELNNMLLGILYCLVYEIKFVLYSKGGVLEYDKGWDDYFVPFCEETPKISLKKKLRFTLRKIIRKSKRMLKILPKNTKRKHLLRTADIWNEMRHDTFTCRYFNIPELGIKGDIFHAKKVLLKMIYNHNDEIKSKISAHNKILNEAQPYISVHIRKGDKIKTKEAEDIDISTYVEKARVLCEYHEITNIFIATDDYNTIQEFKKIGDQDWNIITFCKTNKTGYNQSTFNKSDKYTKQQQMVDFFIDIHFMSMAQFFIGTYTSNIGRMICLTKSQENCYSLDSDWYPT